METEINLYPTERQQKILALLTQSGRVSVAELSQLFGVSDVTIRLDLQALAEQELIVRTHGGAVQLTRTPDISLNLRRRQQVSEKERIAAAAADMITSGDALFLDASSTALALARQLDRLRELTVLTHSLAVAQTLLDNPGVSVVIPGGILQRDTVSLIGLDGLALLRKYNIKTGFFGAHGLSFPEGLTDVSAVEAEIKREVVKMCRQVIALIDSTKWGRIGPASFARPLDLQLIITDQLAPSSLVDQAQASGIQVIQV